MHCRVTKNLLGRLDQRALGMCNGMMKKTPCSMLCTKIKRNLTKCKLSYFYFDDSKREP